VSYTLKRGREASAAMKAARGVEIKKFRCFSTSHMLHAASIATTIPISEKHGCRQHKQWVPTEANPNISRTAARSICSDGRWKLQWGKINQLLLPHLSYASYNQ
jgi:hypothetical protein